jgi:hypothetical protein
MSVQCLMQVYIIFVFLLSFPNIVDYDMNIRFYLMFYV